MSFHIKETEKNFVSGQTWDEPTPEFVKQPVKPTRSFNKNIKCAEDAKKNDEPVIAKDDFKAGNTQTQEEVVLRYSLV